jgi:polyisoprenoid-binding protein YceI
VRGFGAPRDLKGFIPGSISNPVAIFAFAFIFAKQKQGNMKNLAGIMILSFAALTLNSQSTWDFDKAHTSVNFAITHMMISEVDGNFKSFSGKVVSKNDDFTDAQVDFTIDVNSINTDNESRDKHLKSDEFFDAGKFPSITFKSSSFKKVSGNKYELEGDMTMRDVTKKVKLDVVYNGTVSTKNGNKAGFKVTGTINRFDYGLKWNSMMDTGPVLGKDVTLTINVELKKQ